MLQPISSPSHTEPKKPLQTESDQNKMEEDYLKLLEEFNIPRLLQENNLEEEKKITDLSNNKTHLDQIKTVDPNQQTTKVGSFTTPIFSIKEVQKKEITAKAFAPIQPLNSWAPNLKNLQTENQLNMIESCIKSLRNTAIIADTNLKNFKQDAATKFEQNNKFISQVNDWMNKAIKLGGGNYALIQSCKITLANVDFFPNEISQLISAVDLLKSAFGKIEAKTDTTLADINLAVKNFKQSLKTNYIVNDFSFAKESLNSLILQLNNTSSILAPHNQNVKALIAQFKNRVTEIQKYLNGPKNPQLYQKNLAEFQSEISILNENILFLEQYLPKLKSSENARLSLLDQLKKLLMFISELEELHLQFVIGEYQAAEKDTQNLKYNGQDFLN